MKKAGKILIWFAFLIAGYAADAQTIAPSYEVGTWQRFRTAAMSFTFDDGSPNQFSIVLPLFNEFGFNFTSFTVTGSSWGWPRNWTTLQNAALLGHEIASHTVSHTSLSGMSTTQQTTELQDSQNDINAHILGQKCITMAYPYCAAGTNSLCAQYYVAARICSNVIEPRTPADFMNISSIICGDQGSVKTSQDFINRANSAVSSKGWCVFLIHGIDGDGGWSSLSSTVLRETLEYLNANQNTIWVATFGNVACYIKERNTVSVTESSVQDSTIIVQVSDTLDNAIFNYPITIRRPLPQGWLGATVAQNSRPVTMQIIAKNEIQYLQFDAVPDSGDVVISRSNTTAVEAHSELPNDLPTLAQNHPNPFNPTTTIRFNLIRTEQVTLKVYDLSGKEVTTLLDEKLPAGWHSVVFDAIGLASGVYFAGIQTQDYSQFRKMLLLR